jgi:6-phosphogluconolactonase
METPVTDVSRCKIEVFPDPEALSRRAADLFVKASQKVLSKRNLFSAVLSGGSTPKRFYALLGSSPYRDQIGWSAVHIFWADERCVPKDREESNFRLAFETFLSKVPLSAENIHRIKGEDDPVRAAREYEGEMKRVMIRGISRWPEFDLVILGVGEDGHTASLFPGSPLLKETQKLAAPVFLEGAKLNRVTLTLPVLNHASRILFLATGDSKAAVLSEILGKGGKRDRFPAGKVNPYLEKGKGKVIWLIDRAAAGKLRECDAEAFFSKGEDFE